MFLGPVSDEDKAVMLASSDIYVAPHTGGESFGIVLAEAMAAGAPVLASELEAFRAVLNQGQLGELVPVGDADALAKAAIDLLGDPERREKLRAAATVGVRRYDWDTVADDILAVYEMAAAAGTNGSAQARPSRFRRVNR
jgi:phosphatidylinositol alpha-mannosyltransferase